MKCLHRAALALILAIVGCQAAPMQVNRNSIALSERYIHADQHTYLVDGSNGDGSGWALDENTIVSCYHVVDDEIPVTVTIKQGDQVWRAVSFIRVGNEDVVLIDVEGPPLNVSVINQRDLEPCDSVMMAGYPWGLEFKATDGIVLGHYFWDVWIIDGTMLPGMSGGPVFDQEGKVVGMCQAVTLPPGRSVGVIIPISTILEI